VICTNLSPFLNKPIYGGFILQIPPGEMSSERSVLTPRKPLFKSFCRSKGNFPDFTLCLLEKKRRQEEVYSYYEVATQCMFQFFTLLLFGSNKKTKKDLVYTGKYLLNVLVHDLASSGEADRNVLCMSNISYVNLGFSSICISTASFLISF
jgi:hypothetical protein